MSYQKRSGVFPYYRLSSGFLEEEYYLIQGNYYSTGIKASLSLKNVIQTGLGIKLPSFLELYQTYFLGINNINVLISDEIVQNNIVLGFGSDQGVSDFPQFGEDISVMLGTTLGINLSVPKIPVSLFFEAGFGPLEKVNTGIIIEL